MGDYIGTPFADGLQLLTWTPNTGPTINDPPATQYGVVQTANGITLQIFSQATAYTGYLASQNVNFTTMPTHFYFEYMMVIDNPTLLMGHVIETDIKLTDGLTPSNTYNNSAQWNIGENWMFQVDKPDSSGWMDTGVRMPTPQPYVAIFVALEQIIDPVNVQSRIPSFYINRVQYPLPVNWVYAKQEGWSHNQVHLQLQQGNNTIVPGGYSVHFDKIALTQ